MRGEATINASGTARTLRFGNREFRAVEREFGLPFTQVTGGLEGDGFRFETFTALFRIGLERDWPGVTADEAGDLIDEIGLDVALPLLGDCIRDALPQSKKKAAGKGEAPAA